jgi:hypothetical protein
LLVAHFNEKKVATVDVLHVYITLHTVHAIKWNSYEITVHKYVSGGWNTCMYSTDGNNVVSSVFGVHMSLHPGMC